MNPPRKPAGATYRLCPRGCDDPLLLIPDDEAAARGMRLWRCPCYLARKHPAGWEEPAGGGALQPPPLADRKLPPELRAEEVLDCDCPRHVPACRLDGGPGCRDRQRYGGCNCGPSPCRHVVGLRKRYLRLGDAEALAMLRRWAEDLAAEMPEAGTRGHDGYHPSAEPDEPTDLHPTDPTGRKANPRRLRVLRARVRAGQSVARCGDAYIDVPDYDLAALYSREAVAPRVDDRPAHPPGRLALAGLVVALARVFDEARAHGRQVAARLAEKGGPVHAA